MNCCYYLYCLLISLVLVLSCNSNVSNHDWHAFVKHTDVEEAGLKGKVKSVATYACSLGDSQEFCSVSIKKFNAKGFLVEKFDTSGSEFSYHKYVYNDDGLLTKVIFSSNDSFLRGNETYYEYSFKDRRKTVVMRYGSVMLDSFVDLYDKNGNEIESTVGDSKTVNKYDQHGFLTWSKLTRPGDTIEVSCINDDKGRVLRSTRSDSIVQVFIYDNEGNTIEETTIVPKEKARTYLTGYCEFDKNGNYLKKITACKQKKEAFMDKRAIEYY